VLVCALSCTLSGCGSKESTSEDQKKPSASSSVKPTTQQTKPDEKNARGQEMKFADVPPPSSLAEKEAAADIVVPSGPGATGKVDTGSLESMSFPGKTPLTPAEIDALKKSASMEGVDLNTLEVIPPRKPGERGITLGEVKARAAELSSGLADLDVVEVVPPRTSGERGMTLGELKAMGSLAEPDGPAPEFPPNMLVPAGK